MIWATLSSCSECSASSFSVASKIAVSATLVPRWRRGRSRSRVAGSTSGTPGRSGGSSLGGLRREPDGERGKSIYPVGAQPAGRSGELDVGKTSQQLGEQYPQLQSRKRSAQAEVTPACAERLVLDRASRDVELHRLGHDLLVAAPRDVPQDDLLSLADPHAPDLRVARGRAAEPHHRRYPPQDLLDSARQHPGIGGERAALIRVLEQRLKSPRGRVSRGVVAGEHQQAEERG